MLVLDLVASVCLLPALLESWGQIEINFRIEGWFGIYKVEEEVLAIGKEVLLDPPGRFPF